VNSSSFIECLFIMSNSSSVPVGTTLKQVRQHAYRKVILDAAERVFADYGYDAARVQTIAAAAGASVGTIYGVFGSKAELFNAVLTLRLDDVTALASEAASGGGTVIEQIERGLDAYIVYLLEYPDFLRIHLHEHAWGLGPNRASEAQLSAWRLGLDLLANMLERGINDGVIIAEEPLSLARSLVAIQQVYLAAWVDGGMETPPRQVAARLRALFRLMFCVDRGVSS